ncbi:hypothetical protein Bbelb_093960 [Branchiostoma belcheri]|nr:hypothetical protein Bbelb_093960 [Branchiostoma belcheri]
MAEFDFLENPRLMRVPTKKWIENPCERILVPDRDFVYMLEIQDVPVRARDKFIHWRMMTSEEEQTFKLCEQERFWTRSVPFMIGVSAITAVLSRRARYNLWQKAICQYAALTVGRDLGHFTYWYLEHERWAERFMHLQGSTYGEALRRRDCQLQRWYPNGAPPIPKHLLYTRTEPPSSLPPPLPPLRAPLHPPQPPTPSPHLITASLHSEEEVLQFPSDIDEKYTDYSIELPIIPSISLPIILFTSLPIILLSTRLPIILSTRFPIILSSSLPTILSNSLPIILSTSLPIILSVIPIIPCELG